MEFGILKTKIDFVDGLTEEEIKWKELHKEPKSE